MKPKWQKKLTAKKVKHIRETTDSGTLAQFKRNRDFHRHVREAGGGELCYECRRIAVKLGIEP